MDEILKVYRFDRRKVHLFWKNDSYGDGYNGKVQFNGELRAVLKD